MVNKGMTMQGLGAIVVGILALVVVYTIVPVVGSQLDIAVSIPGNAAAIGTLTWSGNATQGNYVNFTYNGGRYDFCFSVADVGCSTPSINVTMVAGVNSSSNAANATASAINANTTLAGVLTATNLSTGVVRITYSTAVASGNNVGTTTNATNATWAAATLTGGSDGSKWNSTVNTSIPTAYGLWESLGGIVKVGSVIVVVGGFLQILRGLRG